MEHRCETMTAMRRLASLAFLLLAMSFCLYLRAASDIFVSQSGGGTGVSCASPRAVSSLTGTDESGGNTVHLCGTITSAVVAQGSNWTLKWESGAKISQPVCPVTGCFNGTGKSNITLDGGGTGNPWLGTFVPNGIIESTANGTNLANHIKDSELINVDGSTGVIIKNLVLQNAYVHVAGADVAPSPPNPTAVHASGVNNLLIDKNVMHDALWLVYIAAASTTVTVSNNELYNADHGGANGVVTETMTGIKYINNLIHDWANWDTNSNTYHHDGIHNFQVGGGTFQVLIVKNKFYGDPGSGGQHTTAHIFNEGNTAGTSVTAIENLFTVPAGNSWNNGSMCLTIGGTGTMKALNNTVVTTSGTASPLVKMEGVNGDFRNNVVALNSPAGGAPAVNSIAATPTFVSGGLANNFYGINPTSGQFFAQGQSVLTFTQWKALFAAGSSQELNSQVVLPATLNINTTTGIPGSGSPALNGGQNLSSLCGTYPDLCTDITGNLRPAVGPWDAGAYQISGAPVAPPNPPTNLSASVSGSTVTLTATASVTPPTPTGYSLYRGTVHGGPYSLVKTALSSPSTTDTPPNGTYFYTMAAFVGGFVSTISGNGATATVTCMTSCASFPTGTAFTIGGNSAPGFNGTFTSTGQPTSSTFTFASSTNSVGSGGAAWPTAQESAKSNEVQAVVPAAATISIAPASLTFAARTVGSPSPSQPVTVTNTSGSGTTVTFSSVTFGGTNPGDFSLSTTCTTLTTPGQQCTTNVTFTPTAPGSRSALLTFVDNAVGSPQTVSVSGTGVAATPGVNLNPTSLNFGDQQLSTTSTVRSIILTNTGTGTLSISSVAASGDFAVVTVPVTNCGGTLAPLATCSLNVTFTPTATGGRTGAVTVIDNASGSPHVATLQGNGINTKCQATGGVTLSGQAVVCGP